MRANTGGWWPLAELDLHGEATSSALVQKGQSYRCGGPERDLAFESALPSSHRLEILSAFRARHPVLHIILSTARICDPIVTGFQSLAPLERPFAKDQHGSIVGQRLCARSRTATQAHENSLLRHRTIVSSAMSRDTSVGACEPRDGADGHEGGPGRAWNGTGLQVPLSRQNLGG